MTAGAHNLAMQIIVKNQKGKVIIDQPAESFVKAFIEMMYSTFRHSGANRGNSANTGGSPTSINASSNSYEHFNTNDRMVVGTGTTPVSMTDYYLDTAIGNGSASGQLTYGKTVYTKIASLASNELSFDLIQIFSNSSGAEITVNEIGLVATDKANASFLLERSLVTFAIPNGEFYSVTYRFRVTTT